MLLNVCLLSDNCCSTMKFIYFLASALIFGSQFALSNGENKVVMKFEQGDASPSVNRENTRNFLNLNFSQTQSSRSMYQGFDLSRLISKIQTLDQSTLSTAACDICKIVVFLIQQAVEQKKSEDEISKLITFVCIELKIEDEKVCNGIVKVNKNEILTVAAELILSPEEVCGVIFGDTCGTPYNPFSNWTVPLPPTPKPPVVPPKPPQPSAPKLRVLHLTDIHVDLLYKPGVNTDCGEPLCCRADNGPPAPGVPGAGYWGDYRTCDVPLHTLTNLFERLAQIQDQFDYILWTGDIPAHNVWNQTRDTQIAMVELLNRMFMSYLPKKRVFPAIGNHETVPVNSYPPPYIHGNDSIEWLYKPLSKSWLNWLPNDTLPTILLGGYYTVSPFPGFRIVTLNNNYCNNENWWLLLNMTDPAGELAWLIDVLQQAEDKKEKVHILSHIPTGKDSCLKSWSWTYYKIINRYESTVVAQFFGHSHPDQFELFYDDVNFTRPTSILYIGASMSTYSDLNPAFRIYTIDGNYTGSSWAVLDHETYILNISHANAGNPPVWQKEYTAKNAYKMTGLYPADWGNVIEQMKTDDTLFKSFYSNYKKGNMHPGECSDTKCKNGLLCGLKSARSHDQDHMCRDLGVTRKEYREFEKLFSFN